MYDTCYWPVIIKNKVLKKKKIVQEKSLASTTNIKIICILSYVMHTTHLINWVKWVMDAYDNN